MVKDALKRSSNTKPMTARDLSSVDAPNTTSSANKRISKPSSGQTEAEKQPLELSRRVATQPVTTLLGGRVVNGLDQQLEESLLATSPKVFGLSPRNYMTGCLKPTSSKFYETATKPMLNGSLDMKVGERVTSTL